MNTEIWAPVSGNRLDEVKAFLGENGLDFEVGADFTTIVVDEDNRIIATGSLEKNVIKCIAVSLAYQGKGLAAMVVSELVKQAVEAGIKHLFIFSKLENRRLFMNLGFYPMAETAQVLLLENERDGVKKFVAKMENPKHDGVTGAVVVNCMPFTNGHLYLIQQASKQCDLLHVFVLSEEQSEFPTDVRFELVRKGISHLENVLVHPTGDYLISSATFPTYFHKDKWLAGEINCELDLTIFAKSFAAPLGITKRFVGVEPFCPVTADYNRRMKLVLPSSGIEVVELERLAADGLPVSASRVRALFKEGKLSEIRKLVPQTTFEYLERMMASAAS
jgi:[citrate (pro-3S)-lyase] ligase